LWSLPEAVSTQGSLRGRSQWPELAYSNTIGTGGFASLLDRITKLDAEMAEREWHLEKGTEGGWSRRP
jgi:hypothetical protein